MRRSRGVSAAALREFPELAVVDDPAVQVQALRGIFWAIWRRPRTWLLAAAAAGVLGVVSIGLVPLLLYLGLPSVAVPGAIGGFAGGATVGILVFATKQVRRGALRLWLVEHGYPVCLACGYDLRGQVEPRCPECGTPADSAAGQE
jgi:membrane associated rhomboid family serine protease